MPAKTRRCSKNETQRGCPVVLEKAPSFQVDTALVLSKSSNTFADTCVAEVNAVIFAKPPENLTSLSTSVETNKLAEAVNVIPLPDVADGVIVVDVVLVSR